MSLTTQEFFSSLEEGEQYISCFTSEEFYNMIPQEIRDNMLVNEIRQINEELESDPIHQALKKEYGKAKRELRNYEYKINQKL